MPSATYFISLLTLKIHIYHICKSFEDIAKLIKNSSSVKAKIYYCDPYRDVLLIIRFHDSYEALEYGSLLYLW